MMGLNTKLVTLMLALVVTAGCAYVPTGGVVGVNYYGNIESTDNGFQMNGYLKAEGGAPEQPVYTDVKVYLYAKNGSRLYSEDLGDLNTSHIRLNVTVTTDQTPYYVVFYSEDFWQEEVQVNYFVLKSGGTFERNDATSRSELPVDPKSGTNNVARFIS
jgi:hypothetical protein